MMCGCKSIVGNMTPWVARGMASLALLWNCARFLRARPNHCDFVEDVGRRCLKT